MYQITKANINLYDDLSPTKLTPQPGADAFILDILLYALCLDRIRVKYQAIIGITDCANFAKDGRQILRRVVDIGQKIDVSGCAAVRYVPDTKQQCPFEHKRVRIGGATESMKETLHGEVLKYFVEGAFGVSSNIQQSLMYGGRYILERPFVHSSTSRYGRMTFSTRQTFAY